jgi:hypothetical protein
MGPIGASKVIAVDGNECRLEEGMNRGTTDRVKSAVAAELESGARCPKLGRLGKSRGSQPRSVNRQHKPEGW